MTEAIYSLTNEQKAELAHRGFITVENPRPFWLNLLIAFGEILVYTTLFSIVGTVLLFLVTFFIFKVYGPDSVTWINLHNPSFLVILMPLFFLTFIVPIFNALNKAMNLGRFFVSEKRGIMNYRSIISAESNRLFSGASFIENILDEIRDRKPETFGYLIALSLILVRYFPLEFLLAASCFMALGIFWRPVFLHFHPLYAFAYLWEKIRDRANDIETQSTYIQQTFSTQKGYDGLKESFERFSLSFSELIRSIIELEKCEKKIHGGDIFDAQKYISSLREDILSPLVTLRLFFQSQKTELLEAQKSLVGIRVGSIGFSGQHVLTSDRAIILLREIEITLIKLDEMISKVEPLNSAI